jgi:hypothetical protein
MTLQQPEVVRVFANDLEIYFKGLEVALERKNTEDAVRYLESMIEEIDYTIDRLQSVRDLEIAVENRKRNIKKAISDYQTGMKQLQGELRRL